MQDVVLAILNGVLLTIPENLFLISFTLILSKRFDMLDIRMWKENLKWIMIPTIIMAIILNSTRYILNYPKVISSLTSLLIFYIILIVIMRKRSFNYTRKDFIRNSLSFLMSFIILGLIENLYYPIILFLIKTSIIDVNKNIIYNFILVIPARVLEISVIYYMIVKRNNDIKFDIFNTIIKSKFLTISLITLSIALNAFTVYVIKLIGFDNILVSKPLWEQTIASIIVLILPIISILWIFLMVNYIIKAEKRIQQTYENLVIQDDVMFDVED